MALTRKESTDSRRRQTQHMQCNNKPEMFGALGKASCMRICNSQPGKQNQETGSKLWE